MQCGLLFVMAWVLAVAECAQSLERLPRNKDHPGKCVKPKKGLIINVGERKNPLGQCVSYRCSRNGKDFLLTTSSCRAIRVNRPCYLGKTDTTKRYPRCCPTAICPK